MKKSTFHYLFDKVLYLLIMLLPLVVLVVCSINGGYDSVLRMEADWSGYMQGIDMYDDIVSAIGPNGVYPMLNERFLWLADYLVYVVYVVILHLLIDCIGFIPAIAHSFMVKIGGDYYE